jgi:hypothetical protein
VYSGLPGRRFRRILRRALLAAPLLVLLFAGAALAEPQVTPFFSDTPGPPGCALLSPSNACGQWTYWMSLGAIVVGLVIVAFVVVSYLRFAPRFSLETAAVGGGAAARPARQLVPPPAATAQPPPAATADPSAAATEAPGITGEEPVAPQPAAPPAGEPGTAPAAPPSASATAPRPPSERHAAVDPDPETFERVLAEQLAKGTDRRVAEGRAKSAALKVAREKAEA